MDAVIGGVLLVLFVLGFMPAGRGVQAAIESFEDPGKPQTQAERDRQNSDMVRLLVLLVVLFGLMFAMKWGVL